MSVDDTPAGSYDEEIGVEQHFLDHAYTTLDRTRSSHRAAQRRAQADHGVGNAQGLTERDAIAAHFGDLAARLEHVEDRLVFGRLDTVEPSLLYIGRIGLSDEDGSPLLIDWRAPAARAFYQATAAHPDGVVRRRHITTKARRVTSIEDELLDTGRADEDELALQGEGALISALSRAREGRMGDIVATIQGEQDRVIRADDNGLIVVQGGPGTGKTAVALHRAAYLLYSERSRLERSGVLLVGPSRVFLRYIEQVLPSLGESGVVSVTMGDLVPGFHAEAVDPEDIDAAKGREAWASVLKAAVRDLQRVPTQDQTLTVWNRSVVLTVSDVVEARTRARRGGQPHNVAREGFAVGLVDLLARRLAAQSDAPGEKPDSEDVDMWAGEVRDSREARRAINLAWMPTSSRTLLDRLFARPQLLARLNASVTPHLSQADLGLVARAKGSPLTVSDIPLIDELEELLGTSDALAARTASERAAREADEVARAREAIASQSLGGGIVTAEQLADFARGEVDVAPLAERAAADRSWTYGHVVVDEAQELTPMGWRSLLRRCPSLSFTVVGDLDQRRGHHRPATWKDALGPAARALSDEYVLSVSYRTPRSLTARAQDVMEAVGEPVRYPLIAVREVEDSYALSRIPGGTQTPSPRGDDSVWTRVQEVIEAESIRLDDLVGQGRGRLAIVVGSSRAEAWGADTVGYSGLDQRVSLLGATGVKGLEFDTVILVEPAEILADGPGDLFVALTRATQRLHVVAAGSLPDGLEA